MRAVGSTRSAVRPSAPSPSPLVLVADYLHAADKLAELAGQAADGSHATGGSRTPR